MQILTILVIEDEDSLLQLYRIVLEKEGFKVLTVHNGQEAQDLIENEHVDLVITDILMPVMDGYEFTKLLRHSNPGMPVLMITAKDDFPSKNKGFSLGTDDYMTKPFSPSELVARVDAIYRRVALAEMRTENNFKEEIHSGEFSLNLRNRYLLKRGQPIELTQVEFQIMEYFFSNPATALDRTDILKHVWGESYFGEEKIVDVNIRRLRMKVEDEPSNPKHIVTVWGLGYKWEA